LACTILMLVTASAVSPFLSGAWLRIAVSIFPAVAMRH